jgi:hypothetical protein
MAPTPDPTIIWLVIINVADPDDFLHDFWKRPVPVRDPDLDKFLVEDLFLDIFMAEICSKKYIHEPKILTKEIPKVFVGFSTHQKSLYRVIY